MKTKTREPAYSWVALRLSDNAVGYFNAKMIASVRPGVPGTTIINDQWLREQMVFEDIASVCEKLGIVRSE